MNDNTSTPENQPRETSKHLGDQPKDLSKLDLAFRAVTAFVALGTIIFAVIQYEGQLRQTQDTAYRESSSPFFNKQLNTYFEISDIASRLATSTPKHLDKAALQRFWQLYWGQLGLVETNAIDEAMIDYGNYLKGYQAGRVDQLCFEAVSLHLQQKLAASIEGEWGLSPEN
jgi:hypothetical protein